MNLNVGNGNKVLNILLHEKDIARSFSLTQTVLYIEISIIVRFMNCYDLSL